MKINAIQSQNNQQNFRGSGIDSAAKFITKNSKFVAGLAGVSAITQKLVMSASEGTMGPVIDVGLGHIFKKVADEKDDRTIQSSNAQAVRTFSQVVGGTIVGIIVRAILIGGSILAFSKIGEKAGGALSKKISQLINPNNSKNVFLVQDKAAEYGKNIGGALATVVMMVTNFVFDVPLINFINKNVTKLIHPQNNEDNKEAK